MLTFDHDFVSDGISNCVLWADEAAIGRLRFNMGRDILQNVLRGTAFTAGCAG
jgi:hypothetical protein